MSATRPLSVAAQAAAANVNNMQRRSPIDELRERVKRKLGYCPTCGQPRDMRSREAAEAIGVAHTTLWRFLSGRSPSADLVDRLAKWLGVRWTP